MANILQVTNPGMNDNRANINTQDPRTSQNNTRIQNPIDPTRVVRPDGREGGRTSGAGEGAYSVIDYESNYGAFRQLWRGFSSQIWRHFGRQDRQRRLQEIFWLPCR